MKILKYAALSAALLAGSCTVVYKDSKEVVHRFSDEFRQSKVDVVLKALDRSEKAKADKFTLIITSPGGSVDSYTSLMHRLSLSPMIIRTEVHTRASSAGAFTFILGDERVIEETAILMFHYARIFYKGVTITASSIDAYYTGKITDEREKQVYKDLGVNRLLGIYLSLLSTNAFIKQIVEARLGADVAAKVLKDGEDIYVSGKEALKLGIATETYKNAYKRTERGI